MRSRCPWGSLASTELTCYRRTVSKSGPYFSSTSPHVRVHSLLLQYADSSGLLPALAVATALAALDTPPPNLHQDVSWLSKTGESSRFVLSSALRNPDKAPRASGYNLCIRFHNDWDPQLLHAMYSIIADLMDLETTLSSHSDPGTQIGRAHV